MTREYQAKLTIGTLHDILIFFKVTYAVLNERHERRTFEVWKWLKIMRVTYSCSIFSTVLGIFLK